MRKVKLAKVLRRLWKSEDAVFITLIMVAFFAVLNRIFLKPYQLTKESYLSSLLVLETIHDLITPNARSLLIVGVVVLLIFNFRKLMVRWSDWNLGWQIRTIVCVSAGLLAWVYSTYDMNDYLGQRHLLDRFILVLVFVGVVWRPIFVFPFLFFIWPMIGQFNVPFGGFSWAIPFLMTRILLLFGIAILLGFFTEKWPTKSFLVVMFCLVAGHYFGSGVGKLKIGWLLNEQTFVMLPNTYANGWLGFMDVPTLESLTNWCSTFNWPMKLMTLFGEVGCLLLFWRKWTLKLFLFLWPMFHVGVFAMSGIFFWPWIVIDLLLFTLVWRGGLTDGLPFSIKNFVLTVVLIATSPYWARGINLSWIESPLTYSYQVIAIGENQERYVVPPFEMGPYDYQFSLGGFRYLSDQPNLPVTWGATGLSTYEKIKDVSSSEEALRYEQEYGSVFHDLESTTQLQEFLQVRFTKHNEGVKPLLLPRWLCAPKYLWTYRVGEQLLPGQSVSRIEIEQVFTGFIKGKYEVIRRRSVCTVELDLEQP